MSVKQTETNRNSAYRLAETERRPVQFPRNTRAGDNPSRGSQRLPLNISLSLAPTRHSFIFRILLSYSKIEFLTCGCPTLRNPDHNLRDKPHVLGGTRVIPFLGSRVGRSPSTISFPLASPSISL